MKIPFSIKYRPQIESGEYKVETRGGRQAKIVSFDITDSNGLPVAAQFRLCAGSPVIYLFNESGEYKGEGESDYDLFLITPGPELSDFEVALEQMMYVWEDLGIEARKVVAKHIEGLRRLAREELLANDTVLKEYAEASREQGKAEALKDLPRWIDDGLPTGSGAIDISGLCGFDFIRRHGKLLRISDLEKLPGFKENEI